MALFPDPTTAYIDPFRTAKTLVPELLHPRPDHGRGLLPRPAQRRRKALAYLETTGIADTAFFAPEAEFYIFDYVRYSSRRRTRATTSIDSVEGCVEHRAEEGGNLGYKTRYKGGYFPVAPYDHYGDLRDEMVTNLEASGLARRARPPRGRHGRSGGDQLPLRRRCSRRPTT